MKTKTKILLALSAIAGASAAGLYLHYLPPVLRKKPKEEEYPFALLLGCPCHKDGTMSHSQVERCKLAMEAYAQGRYKILVIAGGATKNQYVESEEMADFIHRFMNEIPILCETRSHNTWENFEFASKIIKDRPCLILCSNLHKRRAANIANHFLSDYAFMTYKDKRWKHVVRELISRFTYVKIEAKKDLFHDLSQLNKK